MRFRVDIDHIALRDLSLPPARARRVRALVRQQVAEALTSIGDPVAWMRTDGADRIRVESAPESDDRALAKRIAGGVLEALRGGGA